MMQSKKAQFMIVTIVLIGLAFFTVFLLTRTVDRSSVVMFETSSENHFDNLKNAISTRNSGVSSAEWAKLCAHMQNITMASGEKLECGMQNPFGAGKVNYSITYTTHDFSFTGFLS